MPLLFLMPKTVKADTSNESWFSVTVPYSYYMTMDGMVPSRSGEPHPSYLNETNSVSEQHMIILNTTLNVDAANEPVDVHVEYYEITLSSDKGLIETHHWVVVTNGNKALYSEEILTYVSSFSFGRIDWFDTNKLFPDSGDAGLASPNWEVGFSKLWPMGGAGGGTIGRSSSTGNVVLAIREAETLFISVHKIGSVSFTDNSTIVTNSNNELVDQIQLEKFGDGFLYNKLVPEDELSTIDLLHPPRD